MGLTKPFGASLSRGDGCSLTFGLGGTLLVFEFVVEVGTEFGVLGLNVDGDAEDGTCVNQTLGEDAKDGLVNLAGGRYDETCDGKGEAAEEHGYCGAVLDCFFGGGLHFV